MSFLREGAPSAEQQRLDCGDRYAELRTDLRVRQSLPLTQQQSTPLALGNPRQGAGELADREIFLAFGARDDILEQIQVAHLLDAAATPRRRPAVAADVLRDLEEPRQLELRHDASAKSLLRVQEGLLDGVLRILPRAEQAQAIAEDTP